MKYCPILLAHSLGNLE